MVIEKDFIVLLNQHQNIIHKVSSVYMDTVVDKEDLFQEIALQAYKSYKNFKGDSKFSTWLYRVALNTAITFFKKEKRKPITTDEFIDIKSTNDNQAIEEQIQAMYKAIGELSKIDKALVMLYLEDYSYIEIGNMLGITANNVAVKMLRIKTQLKENSKKYYQF